MRSRLFSTAILSAGLAAGLLIPTGPAAAEGGGSMLGASAGASAGTAGVVRNGGALSFYVNGWGVALLPPGMTSRQIGVVDANLATVPYGRALAIWRIASRSDGSMYWAGAGCYSSVLGDRSIPLGNTGYWIEVRAASDC